MNPEEFKDKCAKMSAALNGLGIFHQIGWDRELNYFKFSTLNETMYIYRHKNEPPVYAPSIDLTVREKFMGEVIYG